MVIAGINLAGHRAITIAGLALATAAAWLALISVHATTGIALGSLAELCLQIGGAVGLWLYPSVLAMWLLMSVAMMLPTAMPTIDLYVSLSRRMEHGRGVRIALFVLGYVLAWGAFGAVAAAGQIALRSLPVETLAPALAGGAILMLAGLYQLSPMKQACLALCRNPMLFFMSRWRESLAGTLRLGLEHGVICIGCCWALMLLMFLTGTMNLLWMALLGLVMLAEKILPGAETWGRVGGGLMIAAGAVTMTLEFI